MRGFTLPLLVSAILFAGCVTMSERERSTAKGAAAGAVFGGGLGYAVGGKYGAGIGAASGAIVGAIIGADQPPTYQGTVIVRQIPPTEVKLMLAFIPPENDLRRALKTALIARGWRIHQGIGRPPEATLFDAWRTDGGSIAVETISSGGARQESASLKSVEEALDQALARARG